MSITDRLDAITAFEDQIEEAEAVSGELEGCDDPQYVPAVLAMYERNAKEDDFGVFHAFANYIEQLDRKLTVGDKTIAEHIIDSVKRVPMWKTCELLTMFAGAGGAAAVYTEMLGKGSLDDRQKECVQAGLTEILDSWPDEVPEPVLSKAKAALGQ